MVLINRGARVMVLAAVVMLAGCGGSLRQQIYHVHQKMAFKLGDQWVIKPPRQLAATRIELTCQPLGSDKGQADAAEQKLVVDLTNGRATFQDTDGRVYPQQIARQTVERIGAYMTDRSWQVSRIKADRGAENAAAFHLVVYEDGDPIKPEATWATPSARPLPEALTLLVDTFNEAYRYAHPLSEGVDLLK